MVQDVETYLTGVFQDAWYGVAVGILWTDWFLDFEDWKWTEFMCLMAC